MELTGWGSLVEHLAFGRDSGIVWEHSRFSFLGGEKERERERKGERRVEG